MYNSGFDDDLYKDRNKSFRKAVRAPKKSQRYITNGTYESEHNYMKDTSINGAVKPDIEYSHKAGEKTKYNWKRFLPWAPRTKG